LDISVQFVLRNAWEKKRYLAAYIRHTLGIHAHRSTDYSEHQHGALQKMFSEKIIKPKAFV
jgi:hypothetical protein